MQLPAENIDSSQGSLVSRARHVHRQNIMSSTDSLTGTFQTITSSPEKTTLYSQIPTEKPFHYTYLKEFRVEQCPLFLQHKCTQHRPFTCFHWHFMNQRRRRPKKKRDGVFNYNPDVYCTQYDETTGLCPSGDECPYLHRVAGDVERRYHLRYYKTAICVHETDSRGFCVKNGPHCAFAHGPHDLRQPVYDIRELQAMERDETPTELGLQAHESKVQLEDPRWQDTSFVLAHYKTEQCKKPPRLCRQGYACPHFHNARDCRRSPRKYRYRSTPCPNVKHGDEWGEPTNCENGDNCPYCHTRTEQQFHPEIYKSTKCNDMQQTNYCPRGPFCAFAHVEQEFSVPDENDYGQFGQSLSQTSPNQVPVQVNIAQTKTSRSLSTSSSYSGETPLGGSYARAPGSERSESRSSTRENDKLVVIRKQIAAIESDPNLDESEKARRRQSVLSSTRGTLSSSSSTGSVPSTPVTSVSVNALPFYPAADTVESVVEKALDELHFEDFDVADLEKELNGSTALGSDVFPASYQSLTVNPVGSTAPLTIPGAISEPSPQQSFTPQSPSSPRDQYSPFSAKVGSNPYRNSPTMRNFPSGILGESFGGPLQSPKQHPSPQLTSPLALTGSQSDIDKLSQELSAAHVKLASWEQAWSKAKQACDAWKKEADEAGDRARKAEQERLEVVLKMEEATSQATNLKDEVRSLTGGSYLHVLNKTSEIEKESLNVLKQIQQQLRMDIEKLDRIIYCREGVQCTVCKEERRCMVTIPCNHCVVCENCSTKLLECPQCRTQVSQKMRIDIGL